MALTPGTRIGPYEIIAPIGAGGMGEVYRARDGRLERDVAIKILPELFAKDPERMARFEREARVLASLNHPNIAAIYGLEHAEGRQALVLELVEGRGLDADLARGALPIGEVLRLAIQMADALAAAHTAGVIHRDLKPANVLINSAGNAKVLDFGLAKVSAVESFAATMTAHRPAQQTAEGAVMGTVAYMSPEQAAGRPVDARSDIFSFGSVLFEMITGQRAFDGDTSMSTLAAIIHQPARPVSQLNAAVPRELERIISRCHRKDPAKRVQSMGDLRVALEELRDDLDSGRLSAVVTPGAIAAPRREPRIWAALALVALAASVAGALAARAWWAPSDQASPALTIRHFTADIGVTDDPDVTPNGTLVAYASDRFDGTSRDIWVQPASGGDPVRVTTHAADDSEPAFSPDGSRIAFRSERDGGGIYVVPALGGQERLLVSDGRGPAYSPDGKWLAYSTGGRGTSARVFVMPAGGGAARHLTEGIDIAGDLAWAPDSQRLMIRGQRGTEADAFIIGVDATSAAAALPTGLAAQANVRESVILRAWKGDRLFYSTGTPAGSIWSVALRDGKAGKPEQIYLSTGRIGGVAVDDAGQMYFASVAARTSLWSVPDTGGRAATTAPVQVTATAAADDLPSMSSDGAKIAFRSTRRTDAGAWIRDMAAGTEAALPSPSRLISVALSPDGRSVAYSAFTPGTNDSELTIVGASGGVPRTVCTECALNVWAWTSDGRALLASSERPQALIVVDAATGAVTRLLDGKFDGQVWLARHSPDGRWMSFIHWLAPDRTRIYIAPFRGAAQIPQAAWIPVTDGATVDEEQAWSADGRTLYFVSERDGFRCIYAAPVDLATGSVRAVQPVMHAHGIRRRILSTADTPGRIDLAGGRLVFPMQELHGNIHALTIGR